MLGNFPQHWRDRWAVIREFIRRWHGVPLPDIGGQENRIRDVETKLGYALPPSCREWAALLLDLIDSKAFGCVLRDGLSLSELKHNKAVSLLIQGEADYHWAVKKEHLDKDDPPIDGFTLNYGDEDPDLEFVFDKRWASQTSAWALSFILSYLYIRSDSLGCSVGEDNSLENKLSHTFRVKLDLESNQIYEAKNMIAFVSQNWFGSGRHLSVFLWKPLPRHAIPEFLWEYTKRGGAFSGVFAEGFPGLTFRGSSG